MRKLKHILEKLSMILVITAIFLALIIVCALSALSWLNEHDSLTAFLSLVSLWALRQLFRQLRSRKLFTDAKTLQGRAIRKQLVFGLGAYACLSHLDRTEYNGFVVCGAIVSIVVLILSTLEYQKYEREIEASGKWNDPTEVEHEREREAIMRQHRKKEFQEFAIELGLAIRE